MENNSTNAATLTPAEAQFAKRMEALAPTAIGQTRKMRTDDNTVWTGEVVECTFRRLRRRGRSTVAQWDIVLECGSGKVRKSFITERI